jgi:UrcA family protein
MKTTIENVRNTLLAAAALGAALATGARAADVAQVHVSYADLNVHSPAGAAALDRRIHAAAERVCGVFADRDLARRAQFNACVTGATAAALAAVAAANPQLASAK